MSLRNGGNGTAVLQGWQPAPRNMQLVKQPPDLDRFRPQSRDLFVPSGDVGYWQAAIRETDDDDHAWLRECIEQRNLFMVQLLYSDHDGAQRAIGLFTVAPGDEGTQWLSSVVRHWNLDRPNPR